MAYPNKAKFDSSTPKKILNFNQVFKIVKFLGRGSYGEVVKVIDIINNKPYALKMLKVYDQTIFKEIDMLIRLSKNKTISPHISKYYDHFIYQNKLCILMEFIDGPNADDYFKINPFGLKDYLQFSLWLTNIVTQLHNLGYVHRDIKPSNIIINNKNNKYKLIDFDLSCRLGYPKDPLKCTITFSGTPVFVGPELWNGTFTSNINKYYKTLDVYAVGVSLYYILSRDLPYKVYYKGMVTGKRYHYINIKVIKKQLADKMNDILYGMVNLDPNLRLTAQQAYQQFNKL